MDKRCTTIVPVDQSEGEFNTFTTLVDRLLSVPHSEIQKRVEEHRKKALKNPNRPGPKPKRKPSKRHASRALAD